MASVSVIIFLLLLAAVPFSDQCGPGSNFPTARVLETEPAGYLLMNVTKETDVSWTISLKEDQNFPTNSSLYRWLDAAILINNTADSGFHVFQLSYTIDLEYVYQNWGKKLSVLSYSVTCRVSGSGNPPVSYEWFLEVQAVNEFAPEFVGAPFNLSLPEDTELQTVVIRLRDHAIDNDVVTSSPNDIHEFNMAALPLSWTQNMSDLFSMEDKQNGEVKVTRVLDFELFPGPDQAYVEFNITVWDLSRWNTTSTLTITIVDVDDQPPYFFYPGCGPPPCEVVYSCEVPSAFTGVVTSMDPAPIEARDGDTLDYNITYHIRSVSGLPSTDFGLYVSIDQHSGEFTILQLQDVFSDRLYVIVRAVEVSEKALSKDSTLIVQILHPQQSTTPDTTTSGLNPGFSTEDDGSNSMVIVVVVLAIFIVLALIGLGLVVLYMKKRSDKPIYPASNLKGMEEEDRGEEKRETEGSRTDSGQWSMSGMPSPGPHACSSAPAHTRLVPIQANGHVHGEAGKRRRSQHGKLSPSVVTEERSKEGSLAEDATEHGDQTDSGANSGEPLHSTAFATPFRHGHASPVAHARTQGSGDVPGTGSDVMLDEGERGMENGGPLTLHARRLPPLLTHPPPLASGASSPKRSRASRKQRREQMLARQREEVYDGTKTFPMAADDSFFKDGPKQKVKMSSRRKKRAQHLGRWLTVDNDYTEI